MRLRRLINRLIHWLQAEGISGDKIAECIEYITK